MLIPLCLTSKQWFMGNVCGCRLFSPTTPILGEPVDTISSNFFLGAGGLRADSPRTFPMNQNSFSTGVDAVMQEP